MTDYRLRKEEDTVNNSHIRYEALHPLVEEILEKLSERMQCFITNV